MSNTKYFVLDTNVLLHSSEAITCFGDNTLVLPMTVIEELDKFKKNNDELGRNARQVIRTLDQLRGQGSLGKGVPTEDGGTVWITMEKEEDYGTCIDLTIPDNRIIAAAYRLFREGRRVIFVSKDINARLKADALGIAVMDFEKEKTDFDQLYTGWRSITVKSSMIDQLYQGKELKLADEEFLPNEFVLLVDENNNRHTGIGRAVVAGNQVRPLNPVFDSAFNLRPRSMEQRVALELLMDPEVSLVSLIGQAGTGKTLLALAAGMASTIKSAKYEKLLVSRPVIPLGKDIGYLPGTKDEKMKLWMQPIFDNLSYLVGLTSSKQEAATELGIKRWLREDRIELEALTYIRGRSISRQYVIIDEAQNLTPHEVKTIVSRAGEGTKMILTGDPEQIDNPYLDASSNGLSYTVERLKGQEACGHITLTRSERSHLASLAAEYL